MTRSSKPIELPRAGAATTPDAPGGERLTPAALGALLHFAVGSLADVLDVQAGRAAERLAPVVVIRPGTDLPHGTYRYEGAAHRLVPAPDPRRLDDDLEHSGDAPWSVLLIGSPTTGRNLERAAALLHRLALAAAELDLSPEPFGEVGDRVLGRLDLGRTTGSRPSDGATESGTPAPTGSTDPIDPPTDPADPEALARALLSGRGRADHTKRPPEDEERSRLESILTVAAPRCGEPLFGADAWSAVRRLARAAPLPARDVGLECRLGAEDARVDLAAAFETRLWGAPGSRELLPARGAVGWAALDRFRRAYDASPALRSCTRHLGIELDADGSGPLPAPGLFVGLLDGTITPAVREAVRAGLPALLGEDGSRKAAGQPEAFLDGLPAGSVLHYFGAFSGRAPGVTRFNVQYTDAAAALAHLRRRGGTERRPPSMTSEALIATVTEAFGWGARVVLAWDVGPGAGDRLGIELLFDRPAGVAPVLDRLVRRGVCTQAKRDAVLAWPHALQETEAEAPWPRALRASGRRSPGVRSVLFFKLSHLKLVAGAAGESAKAYLQLQHAWVPPLPRASASRQSAVVSAADPK